jgi:two-component system chemotaxis response regulator CheB
MSIKVLLAEDSAYQRKIIAEMISSNKEIEVVDVARNGREAIQKIGEQNPDVILLDLIMPEVDGLSVLKFLSEHYPIPTIVFTGLKLDSLDDSVQALLLGAFDFIIKPSGYWDKEFPKFKEKLISSILYAGKIKRTYEKRNTLIKKSIKTDFNLNFGENQVTNLKIENYEPVNLTKSKNQTLKKVKSSAIVIGASTGGPKTLKSILKKIPKDFSLPILMVQHLDAFFMKQLAKSLDDSCEIEIKIPLDGEKIQPRKVYLSPGGKHMKVVLRNNFPCIKIFEGDPVNYCIPSVDVLFFSAAEVYEQQVMGVLLTGLGNDGAAGLEAIKNKGGKSIAESEETCIVYGMPKAAVNIGAAKLILPNYKISDYMIKFAQEFPININD